MSLRVGTALREARIAAGIRQDALAQDLGISVFTLNRVEHGTRRFDMNWLPTLPEAMRRHVALALVGEAEEVHRDSVKKIMSATRSATSPKK